MPKKKKTENNSPEQIQNAYEFIIKSDDVIERVPFGSFEIIRTKQGMVFKTFTGFSVFVSRYAVASDGEAHDTSLFSWLDELIQMKKDFSGHESEPFSDGVNYTKGDLLRAYEITTEANLTRPMTVFIDRDYAMEEGNRYLQWFVGMMQKYAAITNSPAPEEDPKKDAEFNAKNEWEENLKEMANENADEENNKTN